MGRHAPDPLAQVFYEAVGASGEEHPRTLGEVSSNEMNEGITVIKINDKPLSLMQKGLIRTVHRVCCLMAGTVAPSEETKTLKDQLDEVVKTVETLTQPGPTEAPPSKPPLSQPASASQTSHLSGVRRTSPPYLPERTTEALGLFQKDLRARPKTGRRVHRRPTHRSQCVVAA